MKKKAISIIIILILLGVIFFTDKSQKNTLVPMFVIEKGFDKNIKQLYFKAKMFESDSNSPIVPIKILVKEKNTWNLIILNKAYLVNYDIYSNSNKLVSIIYDQSFEDTYRNVFYNDSSNKYFEEIDP